MAVISDTHMPRGSRRLPEARPRPAGAADLIVHAGDVVAPWRSVPGSGEAAVIAVHGNVEDAGRARAAGAREGERRRRADRVVHDAGPRAAGWPACLAASPRRAVVFGHSHIPLHERAPTAFRSSTPAARPTRRRSPRHSMGIAPGPPARRASTFEPVALD